MIEPYVADRIIGGHRYSIKFAAESERDAILFCQHAGIIYVGKLDTEFTVAIPGALWIVRFYVWWKNLWR